MGFIVPLKLCRNLCSSNKVKNCYLKFMIDSIFLALPLSLFNSLMQYGKKINFQIPRFMQESA